MIRHTSQTGFTTVELLVSMFVAIAFIATGYQLYTVIVRDGAEARLRSHASNLAYSNLRLYSAQATSPCTTVTPNPTPTLPNPSGLSNASVTVTITCPHGTTSPTSKIVVSVKYGTPQQEVIHALFVTNE